MTSTNLRPTLAHHLRQRLQAFEEGFRHNLALIGPPGSGKTFQLQQLMAHHSKELLVIYCPLYRESSRGFLSRFLTAILQAGLPSSGSSGESLLHSAHTYLPKTASAIRSIEWLVTKRLYGEAFTRALDTIPILVEERKHPCVLIFDEFLFLEEFGVSHAFRELGKRVKIGRAHV